MAYLAGKLSEILLTGEHILYTGLVAGCELIYPRANGDGMLNCYIVFFI